MDVITPPDVDQSVEVDYTINTPVVLSGVTIPYVAVRSRRSEVSG